MNGLTNADIGMLEEACWLAIELLDTRIETDKAIGLYDDEDMASMEREIEQYTDLANRLNLMRLA